MSFTDVFGGDTLFPSDLSYRAVTLSASTTLQWPTEASAGTNLVAAIMDVTATAGSLSLTMPPATEVSTGTAVVFNNVGGTTFTVLDNGGNTLLTVASGLIWTLYLTDNSTANGSWETYQNGAGTSSASAASLAGYGLKAITTTLNQTMPVTSVSANFTADDTYRAGVWVWTGGAGVVSLTDPATLGNDWFFNIKNSGSGSLVLTPLAGSIDGETTVTLSPDESAIVVTDGTNFFTIGLTPIPTPGFDYTAIAVPGSGNYTLAGTEVGRISYSFTGALTGVRTIIIPASVQQYWVSNDTTGSTTGFFVKTSSQAGSGVSIPPGLSRLIRCDGNNAIDAASNPIRPQLPTGTGTNTVTVTIPTAPSQYVDGFEVNYVAQSANTNTVAVNVNSIGDAPLLQGGVALSANAIISGQVVRALYKSATSSFEMGNTNFAGDGSLSAPSFAFNGDRDTGRYLSGANQMVDVTSGAASIVYHAAGYLNFPRQCAFLVGNTATDTNQTGNGATATVDLDGEVFDIGGNFASDTFTAPVTGKYFLQGYISLNNFGAGANTAQAILNTSNRQYVAKYNPLPTTNVEAGYPVEAVADMDAGDTATLQIIVSGMAGNTVNIQGNAVSALLTWFSGVLVA